VPDLAARLRAREAQLRRALVRPGLIGAIVHEANATLDPARIADVILDRAATWLLATSWAVIATDRVGNLRVLASRGAWKPVEKTGRAIAAWVVRKGEPFVTADTRTERRLVTPGAGRRLALASRAGHAVIAIPLFCRGRVCGAAVGIDRHHSRALPTLAPALRRQIDATLEPAAVALDNALRIARAEALSVTDDLTSLYNSRYLSQVLRRETKRATRNGRPVSLLFIDLDGFKNINDQHGHLCGSRALVEAARVIRSSARETDMIARYGGDEFALLLPDTGSDGAVMVAERIRERIAGHQFLESEGLAVRLTASVGIATLPDVATSVEALVRAADMAMYRVKAAGKNGIDIAV
jgi:diguanylate cyclase (GGDEF)-like protein